MTVAAAALMRPSHRAARVTAALAAALMSLPREIRDTSGPQLHRKSSTWGESKCLHHYWPELLR